MQKEKILSKKLKITLAILFFCASSILLYSFLGRVEKFKVFVFSSDEYLLYKEFTDQWFSMTEREFLNKNYNKETYTLYLGKSNMGTFNFQVIQDKLELVNTENEVITRYTKDKWFSYGGSSYTKYIKYTTSSHTRDDDLIIFEKLKQNKVEKDYDVSYLEKYTIDFDNDTKNETIYIVSNLVSSDKEVLNTETDKVYSFMFMLDDDGKYYDIYSKVVNQENLHNICLPTFEGALTIGRGKRTVISYCEYFKTDTYKLNLYNYENFKFSNISIN